MPQGKHTLSTCARVHQFPLLEHSRIYGFGPRDNMKVKIPSSADPMTRNMDKRIEIARPVLDSELREQIPRDTDRGA